MARLLNTLGNIGTVYQGFVQGQDAERARQRVKTLRGREDERYGHEKAGRERASQRGELEHEDFMRVYQEEKGAREVAAGASAGEPVATATGTTMPDDGTRAPVRALGAAGGGTPEAVSSPTQKALWLQQAEAQRDYWIKKGRPERAAKAMTDAINAKLAESEAVFNFDVQPKVEAIRKKGLDAEELEQDLGFRDLRLKAAEADTTSAGLMWGHVLSGNKKAAIDAFNASGATLPGVQIADIAQSADGTKIYLVDAMGRVAKDKQGRDLVYPRQLLDNLWRRASTSTLKVSKGESVYQTRTGPTGELTATPVITAPDPTERRLAAGAARDADAQWATVLNRARDDVSRYLKDSLGLTANALGQVMKPENQPTFERAAPIAEAELQKFRSAGKRLDQVTATDIAKRALAQAREEIEREKAGAGAFNPNAPAPAGGPWRHFLQ